MEGKVATSRKVETLGKSQLDLILQVYDGAIKAYREAAELYRSEDFEAGYDEMERAKRFVTHLYTTLDLERGGEVAANLGRLYVFVISETYIVQATKDLDQLAAITQVMENLRLGWSELKEQGVPDAVATPPTEETTPTENGRFVTTA
jgi:flagellar protein FliS